MTKLAARNLTFSVVTFAAVLLVARPAHAATLVFAECTESSLCGLVTFTNQAQPDPGYTNGWVSGFRIEYFEFGVNVAPDVAVSMEFDPTSMPFLGPGEIGPYGTFTHRWDATSHPFGYNLVLGFKAGDGSFEHLLAPFFENDQGFTMAVRVRNSETGASGFVAAPLVDVAVVPEPGTMILFGTGALLAARAARRKRTNG